MLNIIPNANMIKVKPFWLKRIDTTQARSCEEDGLLQSCQKEIAGSRISWGPHAILTSASLLRSVSSFSWSVSSAHLFCSKPKLTKLWVCRPFYLKYLLMINNRLPGLNLKWMRELLVSWRLASRSTPWIGFVGWCLLSTPGTSSL